MVCPVDRIGLSSLAQTVAVYFPNISERDLVGRLGQQLNAPYDKTTDGSNPYASISRGEAGGFILEAQSHWRAQGGLTPWDQTVMTALQQMFFQGRVDWQMQNPEPKVPATIPECADGDTCKAVIQEAPSCSPLAETLRFSAVDTPESFVSSKLYRVRDEVAVKLSAQTGVPVSVLAPLVESWIRFEGKIAALLMKDFPVWLQNQGMNFAVSNSYIFFEEGPKRGLLQPYDKYLRRLVTLHAPPHAIARYFAERLPQLMATQGKALRESVLANYSALFAETVRTNQLRPEQLEFLSPARLPDPAQSFTPQQGQAMAAAWSNQIVPTGYGDDFTAAIVFAGVGYYYAKYRNQHGAAYLNIQQLSQTMRNGLWSDLLFQLMAPPTRRQLSPASLFPEES
ncbi:MAG: hypothetical protein Q7S68_03265 [Deltaproteobacteria bacterium]|nr:hypothetical protein [Deltaproteobacteria bacterium]